MKLLLRISLCVLFGMNALTSTQAFATGNPSQILVTIYGVAVSTNADCSNPLVIFDSLAGMQVDFLSNPVLGGGDIPDGTYPCVMINMSDVISFSPAATDGAGCVAGTTYSQDICNTNNSCTFQTRTGTTFTASANAHGSNTVPQSDVVTMFLTTSAVAGNGGNFLQPVNATNAADRGMRLVSPFVVSGSTAGRFVVDATGKISGSAGVCNLDAPVFSFR